MVRLWTLDGQMVDALTGSSDRMITVRFSPTGEFLASGDSSGNVTIWSPKGEPQTTLTADDNSILALDVSPDGRRIVVGQRNGAVRLWHLSEFSELIGSLKDALFVGDGTRFYRLSDFEDSLGVITSGDVSGAVNINLLLSELQSLTPWGQSVELRGHIDRVIDLSESRRQNILLVTGWNQIANR